ncbi:hypothetical protein C162_16145 [Paenibacillus sp. FSL R7-269]|uniref:hypothetical protein n=1 Tax=Paenibacillus sp. FSL R7-269 TaxID=1226755 RepID=UPI0003E23CB6|nr:hypothetical protein [Paenibacillus sp. FSL R7-269]ETT48031.1 hypothetical protein C162_16145 [Paenibacillus sp. FSL R7-269]
MKLSDIRCERLSKKDSIAAAKLLSLDADTGPDLLQVLEEEPEVFIAAYVGETLRRIIYSLKHINSYILKTPDNSEHSRSGPSLPASLQ